jgi:hypothetical protein
MQQGESYGGVSVVSVSMAVEVPETWKYLRIPVSGLQTEEARAQTPTDTVGAVLRSLVLGDYLLARPLED